MRSVLMGMAFKNVWRVLLRFIVKFDSTETSDEGAYMLLRDFDRQEGHDAGAGEGRQADARL
jgi:hypothetical protein